MSDNAQDKRRIHIETEQSGQLPEATDAPQGEPAAATEGSAETQGEGEVTEANLEEKLAALEAELEEEKDRRLRALAELQNFRRRSQEERAQQMLYANERLLADLIPVIDHFEMATQAAELNEQTRMVCRGYEMILQQLKDVTARYGLEEIPTTEGMFFDPQIHDAVERVPTEDPCEGTVVKVLRRGYKLHDRVLRPVQVAVAVPPS